MSESSDIVILTSFMGSYIDKIDQIKLEISNKVVPVLNKMGFQNITIEEAFPHRILLKPGVKIEFDDCAPKGVCARECLEYSLETNNPKYIIWIDGTLKIPLTYIIDLATKFIEGGFEAVLSERIGEDKAISQERWFIEKFELFLLEEKYNHEELPDGQCGLWGFKVFNDSEKRITITCKGYEIELDLISEILRKHLNFGFIQIKVSNPEKKTGFTVKDHIDKLNFISEKENLLKHHIVASMQKFYKERMKLPEEYMKEIEKWSK